MMSNVFGKKLGNYVLLEQLGEGGMAKVYNAFDPRAERSVAIKVILPSKRSSRIFLQQFETEAKALANLTHTNIVKVLNYGIEDGQPYLVMDYISGGTLKDTMGKPIPWQTAAAILSPIARALDYVHHQQIVHRDVKPSNILLYEDFRPMLSDFGIVKLLESKEEMDTPAIGVGVGTPEYMSPEQGMGKEVDYRADIYSLGLVFYEMVTGQKPFTADTPMAAVLKHITDDLILPRQIDKGIPKFVEQAMLRAVQKNPEDRYPNMGDFADVLEMIALGEKAPRKRIQSLSRKHRQPKAKPRAKLNGKPNRLFIMAVLIVLVGVAAFVFSGLYSVPLQQTNTTLYTPTIAVVEHTATSVPLIGNLNVTAVATATSLTVPTLSSPTSPFSSVTLLGTPLAQDRPLNYKEIAKWGIGGVNVVKWSPDGTVVALGTTSGIFLYDANSKELQQYINTEFNAVEMTFSPDGETIVAGSMEGVAKAWNVKNGQYIREFGYKKPINDHITQDKRVNAIVYSQNGGNIAIGYEDGTLNYFIIDQDSPVMVVGQYPSIEDLVISGDNRFIYVSNGTNKIFVWDIAAKKNIGELSYPIPIDKLKLSQDRQFLLSSGTANLVYMLDLFEDKIVSSFSNLGGVPTDFDISSDDRLVAISLNTGGIKVFNKPNPEDYSKTQQPVLTIDGSGNRIRSLAFSPDQPIFASGSWEDGLLLWNAQAGIEPIFSLDASMGGINEIYFSTNGAWLATSHKDGNVRIWNVAEGRESYQFPGYLSRGVPFSPNSQFLVIVRPPEKNKSEAVQIVELRSGNIVAELSGYQSGFLVQFSDDSKILVTGDTQNATIWDVSTWEKVNSHGGMNAGCGQYFSPQNELLAVISNAGVLFSYTEKIRDMCATKPEGAKLVYYFQSQHMVYFVLGNGALWSWDFRSTGITNIFRSGTPYPFSNDVFLTADERSGWYVHSPSGEKLIVMGNAGMYTLSEVQNDYRYRVAMSPSNRLIALGSQYGSIHIWTTP
jgi:serine/threonine protein kinase